MNDHKRVTGYGIGAAFAVGVTELHTESDIPERDLGEIGSVPFLWEEGN